MKWLIQWAVTSSIFILIVLAVRYLFRERLSARLRYALWGVVLLRLLVPFQIELPAPISHALPLVASNLAQEVDPWLENQMLYAVPTRVYPGNGQVQPGEPSEFSRTLHGGVGSDWDYYAGGVKFDENGTTRYAFMMPASELLLALWKWGAVLFLFLVLYSNWCFSMRLESRRKRLEHVDAPIPVYVAEGLPSPCLFGVFFPAVYLTPGAVKGETALGHVLAHELTHYRHRDHLWSLLRTLALALHWYNPLVWLAAGLSKGDGELACDEGAVKRLGEAERIPYGRTLVDMVAARSARPADLLSCSTAMTGGSRSIQRRVAALIKRPETAKAALFAAAAVLVLAGVFVFAGRGNGTSSDLATYLTLVEKAPQLTISPPPISSQYYPPITDEDLLAEAKAALSDVEPIPSGGWQPPEELWLSPCLSLNGDASEYALVRRDYGTDLCFLRGGRWSENPDPLPLARTDRNLIALLEDLARQQGDRNRENTPAASDLYKAFLDRAGEAASIQVEAGDAQSSGQLPPITDPEWLEQARTALLSLAPLSEAAATIRRSEAGLRREAGASQYAVTLTDNAGEAVTYYIDRIASTNTNYLILSLEDFPAEDPEQYRTFARVGVLPGEAAYALWLSAKVAGGELPPPAGPFQTPLLGSLTWEQVEQINEAFRPDAERPNGSTGPSEISCFFTSSYDDPTQINLEEFLRYCPIGVGSSLEEGDTEEFLAVMERDNSWFDTDREFTSPLDLPVPVHRYPREEVSALLQKYAGVTVEELDWEDCLYVEEYDAFYNFTSDFGPGFFHCEGGNLSGDTVLLWSEPDGNGDRCELTLRRSGERWLIQSHHTTYPR